MLPCRVPGIAFGVGVALFWLRMPIAVYGTIWIIVLAFIGRFSGYAVRSISSSIVQVHPELEESAQDRRLRLDPHVHPHNPAR